MLLLLCIQLSGVMAAAIKSEAYKELPEKTINTDTIPAQKKDSYIKEYNKAYYILHELNTGLPKRPSTINLQTPRAAMEHFFSASRNNNYEQAIHSLNFNLLPESIEEKEAIELARKLYYVLNKRVNINWDNLPDRPDGLMSQSRPSTKAIAGNPRKSIVFGTVSLNNHYLSLRLQRVKIKNQSPVWLISSNTVENIETLYKDYGPGKAEKLIPQWAKIKFFHIPVWEVLGILLSAVLCFFLGKACKNLIKKLAYKTQDLWIIELMYQINTPLSLALGFIVFYLIMNQILSTSGSFSPLFYSILLIVLISSITWVIMRSIDYFMERLARKQIEDVSVEESDAANNYLTYISVARRVITFIIIIIGFGVVLSQFPSLQNLGVSLMASAGVATIILGIAAQSTLGNIIAGIQIAITKPAQIGDNVIFEEQYGTIEDIRFTYLVIRTWDMRRIVVPLKYFITNPFQNWSMTSKNMIKPICIYADHKINVDKVRKKFTEMLRASDDYDEENPPTVQVISSTKDAIEIMALCSAKNPTDAWYLHCSLREKLISYVAHLDGGRSLAKERVEIQK